jgi:hypothetical protein
MLRLSVLLLIITVAVPSLAPAQTTIERPRKPVTTETCECSCRSDEKRLLLSGAPIWKYSSDASFTDIRGNCGLNNGHVCQVTKPDGGKTPGKLASCTGKTTQTLTINPNKLGPNLPGVTVNPNRGSSSTPGR